MKYEVCVLNVRLRSRCRTVAILLEVRELKLKWAVSRRQILNSFQTKGCTLMYWHHIDIIIIKQWLVFKDKCWINSKLYRRRNLLGHPLCNASCLYRRKCQTFDSAGETNCERQLAVVCSLWLADCCYICISEDLAVMTIHHSTSTGHCTIICHSHTPETPVSLHNQPRAILLSSLLLSAPLSCRSVAMSF